VNLRFSKVPVLFSAGAFHYTIKYISQTCSDAGTENHGSQADSRVAGKKPVCFAENRPVFICLTMSLTREGKVSRAESSGLKLLKNILPDFQFGGPGFS
jgi:hypothetical protein